MKRTENQVSQISIFTDNADSSVYDYKESLEKIQEQLSSFGLTSNQCKIYIFLGKHGSKTAPDISKILKLPRTETYKLLATLQSKGIVSASFQHPIQFTATSLNEAVHLLINTEKIRIKKIRKSKIRIKSIVGQYTAIPQ